VVGSLVSDLGFGTVTGCYAKGGSVSGDVAVGGLVGNNYNSTIMKCYSTCSISGGNGVGGLVGSNYDSTIMKCYSTSSVSGNEFVGGLVGLNYGSERPATITNCYSRCRQFGGKQLR
ncbi:MAG: GLUG motif-containing protein, partial [Planctomycetota bacterium]